LIPGQIFDYAYVEDRHLRSYDEERRLGSLLIFFCQLTVFVVCLGIFGLAANSTEQRTKGIGIRKILGAGAGRITILFTNDYLRWVTATNLIAWPMVYFAVNKWLRVFAYRTSIGPGPFSAAGFITLAVALLSLSIKS
jgi:putative ABC transport system permease protein